MISEAKAFWDPISGKVKEQIQKQMGNALQVQRYDVTTEPDGDVMGVAQPFGSNEIFLPYSKEVAGATVGDTVLVAWWGSMSNARVYYFAKGYDGGAGGGDAVIASITFPAAWTDSGNGYYTAAPTIDGATLSAESKIDLQITAAQFLALQADGVENLYVENDNAALTAYAVGGYPSASITLQCTITGTQAPTPPVNPSLDMIYPIGSIYTAAVNVNPGNTIGGTWERVTDTATYLQKDLLWTNPNPTSNFSAQTVALDLSGYDAVRITFIANMNAPVCYTQEADIDSYDHLLSVVSAAPARQSRGFTFSSAGIVFENGASGSSSGSQYGVPIKIYGIKETSPFDGIYRWTRTA